MAHRYISSLIESESSVKFHQPKPLMSRTVFPTISFIENLPKLFRIASHVVRRQICCSSALNPRPRTIIQVRKNIPVSNPRRLLSSKVEMTSEQCVSEDRIQVALTEDCHKTVSPKKVETRMKPAVEEVRQALPMEDRKPPLVYPVPSADVPDLGLGEEGIGQAIGGQEEPQRSGRTRSQPARDFDPDGGVHKMDPTKVRVSRTSGQNPGTYYSSFKEIVCWCLGISEPELG